MSNRSQLAEVSESTCPAGCVLPHDDDEKTFHAFGDVAVNDVYGKPVLVSAFIDERDGKSGVYVGGYELSSQDAEALANAIRSAAYSGTVALLERR
jgi:hypothetical protein